MADAAGERLDLGAMTPGDKAAGFLDELNALTKRWGVQVVPILEEKSGLPAMELRERDAKHSGELRVVAGVEDRTVVR
jgi:hypothetical protein